MGNIICTRLHYYLVHCHLIEVVPCCEAHHITFNITTHHNLISSYARHLYAHE